MNMFVLIVIASLILIYLCVFSVVNTCQKRIQFKISQKNDSFNFSKQIMNKVETNNTYPKLLDIFTHLDSSVEQHEMELNSNFEGYFKNECIK